jgi:hypothetical protein
VTLLYIDGFAHANNARYATSTPSSYLSADPRVAATYYCTGNAGTTIRRTFTAAGTLTTGTGVRVTSLVASKPLLSFYGDANTTQHITIVLNATGNLVAYRGTAAGTLLATGSATLAANTWFYVETLVTISDTVGVVQCRINGASTPDLNFSGDTKNAGTATTVDAIGFGGGAATDQFSDWYILNSSGSVNNTWLGAVSVFTITPSGNGTYSDLTGSDSNQVDNYALVDELPPSSTDYTQGDVTGYKDSYVMPDLPANTGSVCGVQVAATMARSDVGVGNAKILTRSGGTSYTPTSYALTTIYTESIELKELDPATSAAWTPSGVNALELGIEVL